MFGMILRKFGLVSEVRKTKMKKESESANVSVATVTREAGETVNAVDWNSVDSIVSDSYKLWQGNEAEKREKKIANEAANASGSLHSRNSDSLQTLRRIAAARAHAH